MRKRPTLLWLPAVLGFVATIWDVIDKIGNIVWSEGIGI